MLSKIYYGLIRKIITHKNEQNQYSGGLWPRKVRETAAAMIKDTQGRLVELGCGEGIFLEKLAHNNPGSSIYGIDSWIDIINKATVRLSGQKNITLIHANALVTGVEDAFFDYCFCVNTVQNLFSIEVVRQLFKESLRILKPGGIFIFDSRNSLSPIITLQYRFVKWYDPGITVPLRAYRASTIEQLLKENGFILKEKHYIGYPPNRFAPAILFVAQKN
jgi:ubiquinone/menaquinone biosynthesis C-methylase UbiE